MRAFRREMAEIETRKERGGRGARLVGGEALVVLPDEGDVLEDRKVRQKRDLFRNGRIAVPERVPERGERVAERLLRRVELYRNRATNDSTSMTTIAMNTLTMPRSTDTGTAVR